MLRERALKVVLIIVGVLFLATLYPLLRMQLEESLQMMLSIYVTLGVFLLLAAWNPSAHRSLIASAAWSSIAHAGTMAVQSLHDTAERMHLQLGALAFGLIGVVSILLSLGRSPANARSEAGVQPF